MGLDSGPPRASSVPTPGLTSGAGWGPDTGPGALTAALLPCWAVRPTREPVAICLLKAAVATLRDTPRVQSPRFVNLSSRPWAWVTQPIHPLERGAPGQDTLSPGKLLAGPVSVPALPCGLPEWLRAPSKTPGSDHSPAQPPGCPHNGGDSPTRQEQRDWAHLCAHTVTGFCQVCKVKLFLTPSG